MKLTLNRRLKLASEYEKEMKKCSDMSLGALSAVYECLADVHRNLAESEIEKEIRSWMPSI